MLLLWWSRRVLHAGSVTTGESCTEAVWHYRQLWMELLDPPLDTSNFSPFEGLFLVVKKRCTNFSPPTGGFRYTIYIYIHTGTYTGLLAYIIYRLISLTKVLLNVKHLTLLSQVVLDLKLPAAVVLHSTVSNVRRVWCVVTLGYIVFFVCFCFLLKHDFAAVSRVQ